MTRTTVTAARRVRATAAPYSRSAVPAGRRSSAAETTPVTSRTVPVVVRGLYWNTRRPGGAAVAGTPGQENLVPARAASRDTGPSIDTSASSAVSRAYGANARSVAARRSPGIRGLSRTATAAVAVSAPAR